MIAALEVILVSIALGQDVDLRALDDASALGQAALFAQAFVPGIAALVARLVTTGSVRGLGWRPTRRHAGASYLLPVAAIVPVYLLVWLLDGAAFDESGSVAGALAGLTLGTVAFLPLSLGEELGWRGLLAARLAETMPLARVALWTGLAWTAFHLPLLLLVPGAVDGVPTAYAVAVFGAGLIALSYPMAWLQVRTGSVWPAVLLHSAYNAALYLFADPLTTDEASPWLVGEASALLLVATVAAALGWRLTVDRRRRRS